MPVSRQVSDSRKFATSILSTRPLVILERVSAIFDSRKFVVNLASPSVQKNPNLLKIVPRFRGIYRVLTVATDFGGNTVVCEFSLTVSPSDCAQVIEPSNTKVKILESPHRDARQVSTLSN